MHPKDLVCAHMHIYIYISISVNTCTRSHMPELTHTCTHTHAHTLTRGLSADCVWLYCLGHDSMPSSATVPVSIATLLPRTSIRRHTNQPDWEECQKEQRERRKAEESQSAGLFLFAWLVVFARYIKNMPI